MDSEKQYKLFKTPQSLVHIKHSITILQYKYWYLLLQSYKDHLIRGSTPDDQGFYSIPMGHISTLLGYTPSTKDLRNDLENLRQQPIIINYLEKDGKQAMHGTGFLSEWKVSSNRISFIFPSFLRAVLLEDKSASNLFSILNWSIFNSFNGKYEAIIYKLCKDYVDDGQTPYMTVAEYRNYIGLEDNAYEQFKELNRNTITNPIISINDSEFSDISVDVEYTKNGRKVEGFLFKITVKNQENHVIDMIFHPAFRKAKINLSFDRQEQYLAQHSPEQIEAIIDRANEFCQELETKGRPVKLGAIYHKAFAESWGVELIEVRKKEANKKARKQAEKELEDEQREHKKAIETAKQEQEEKEKDGIKKAFFDLSWEEQTAIMLNIREEISPLNPFYKILSKAIEEQAVPKWLFTGEYLVVLKRLLLKTEAKAN